MNRVDGLEEVRCLRNGHVEHLGDVLALVVHFQGLAVIASALTHLTRNIHVRQEVHLDLDGAIALACLAAPTLDIEGEAAGLVAANLGLLGFGKKVTDLVKDARIGCWVGTRGAANRALVNLDQLIQVLHALDALGPAGDLAGAVELIGQSLSQNLIDHGGFTRTGNAGNTRQHSQRDFDVYALQVILACTHDFQGAILVDLSAVIRYGEHLLAG